MAELHLVRHLAHTVKSIHLLLLLVCFFSLDSALADSPQQIAKAALPSTVAITTFDRRGNPVKFGSGFIVAPGLAATNLHVLQDAASGSIRTFGMAKPINFDKVVLVDRFWDLAVISIEGLTSEPLKLLTTSVPNVGDKLFVIGNPQGLEGTFTEGIVSAVRDLSGGKLLQISAPISAGSSGGPVLNESGIVVGVAVASVTSGQNLNFAIPSRYLHDLLGRPHAALSFGQLPRREPEVQDRRRTFDELKKVPVEAFTLHMSDRYQFALDYRMVIRNTLERDIQNVKYLIFEVRDGVQFDYQEASFPATIRHGLAKRISGELDKDMAEKAWGGKWLNDQGDNTFGREEENFQVRVTGFDYVE